MVRQGDGADVAIVSDTELLKLPDPLHPAIVHFPVVLAVILPLFAAGALWAIRRGARPRRAWAIPLSIAAALAASAWAAVETGEDQDERVERVVAERPLSAHEEMAEAFFIGSGALLLLTAAGLAPGMAGRAARAASVAASLVLVVGAARVGHSGGQLVYRYGAAAAYVDTTSKASAALHPAITEGKPVRGDDDER
jgi:uncharacterized membrane protein